MTDLHTEPQRANWLRFVAGQTLPLEVTCKRWAKSRTSKQNRWLRALESDIGEYVGYSLDEVHTWILGDHFGWKDVKVPRSPRNPDGVASAPVRTTTTDENGKRNVLKSDEWAKFAAHAERIAAKAGVYVSQTWQQARELVA